MLTVLSVDLLHIQNSMSLNMFHNLITVAMKIIAAWACNRVVHVVLYVRTSN